MGAERTERLDDVMAVIYLIFNEGYTATTGEDWMRQDLVDEAIRLAWMLVYRIPDEPEVFALEALLEIQGWRTPARLDEHGIRSCRRSRTLASGIRRESGAGPGGPGASGGVGRDRGLGRACTRHAAARDLWTKRISATGSACSGRRHAWRKRRRP